MRSIFNVPLSTLLMTTALLGSVGCGTQVARTSSSTSPVIRAISITPASSNLAVAQSRQYRATARYADGSTADITSAVVWEGSASSVSTLNAQGLLTCNVAGGSQISASVSSVTGTASVTCLSPQFTRLHLESIPSFITSNSPFQYRMLADYADGTTEDVTANTTWTTDPSIAGIYPHGIVSCNNAGTAEISATYSGTTVQAPFICVLRPITPKPGFVEFAKTFDGPFASWIDIKARFGAKGDGVTDDSAAFQAALDSMAAHPYVLWIPRGTYLITRPLTITGTQNVTILGEDPLTTTVAWAGQSGGTMLTLSGCAVFNVGRLTWDGRQSAGVVLEVTWNAPSNYYPTRNFIHDSRIINTATGIHTGWAGETTVDRVHFDHNTQAGISLGNYNALNFNVLDSLFTDNALGVTNIYGAGAFNISNSVFVRSTTSDIAIGNTGPFSFRSNLSIDSKMFLQTGMTGAPANIIIQGNTVSNPSTDPISTGTPGSLMILDNQFLNLDPSLHILNSYCYSPISFISLGNTYSVPQPFVGNLGQYTSLDDVVSSTQPSVSSTVPTEVYFPPFSHRTVFDLPSGSSSAAIQEAINGATAVNGVVHLSAGNYDVTQALEVSADADIGILGDGALTILSADPNLQGPVLRFDGTTLQLADILLASKQSTGYPAIALHVPDALSTRIFCDECASIGGAPGIEIDGLDDASIEFRIATLNGSLAANVHGGTARNNGLVTLGSVQEFMTSSDEYHVDLGGHLLNEDGWHDAGQGPIQFVLTGQGSVTQQGGTIYSPSTAPAMTLNGYGGRLTLLGVATNSYISANSESSTTALVAGVLQVAGENPVSISGPSATVSEIDNASTPDNSAPTLLPNALVNPSYVERLMSQARTEVLAQRKAILYDSTVVRMERVVVQGFGIQVIDSNTTPSMGSYTISAAVTKDGKSALQQSCGTGQVSMAGTWTLQDGGDGFLGLVRSGTILSESIVTNADGDALAMNGSMTSARDRWLIRQIGDGSVKVINRATGDVLTQATSGCAYAVADDGAVTQHWLIGKVD